jgi:hypothetical protein
MGFPVVEEIKVLKATIVYLGGREVLPYRFSMARGKGINVSEFLASLSDMGKSTGFTPQLSSEGADIEDLSETEWWRIECKGTGTGTSQTQRNNFDRALASVVTYFEEPPYPLPPDYKKAKLFLGLAIPASPDYLRQLKRRVRLALRKHLNLWVLLYEPSDGFIREVSPNQEY